MRRDHPQPQGHRTGGLGPICGCTAQPVRRQAAGLLLLNSSAPLVASKEPPVCAWQGTGGSYHPTGNHWDPESPAAKLDEF
jgi:hypothetical protein